MKRLRELAIKQKTALSNQIKGLLLAFNVRVSTKNGGLIKGIESVIKDAENELLFEFREALNTAYKQYEQFIELIKIYDMSLEKTVNACFARNHRQFHRNTHLENANNKLRQNQNKTSLQLRLLSLSDFYSIVHSKRKI
jgi:hypothetical protein